jgi:hypothetical protein
MPKYVENVGRLGGKKGKRTQSSKVHLSEISADTPVKIYNRGYSNTANSMLSSTKLALQSWRFDGTALSILFGQDCTMGW